MKKLIAASLLFLSSTAIAKEKFVSDQVIVRYKDSATKTIAKFNHIRSFGPHSKRSKNKNAYLIKTAEGDVLKTIAELKKDPSVASAQPNYIYKLLMTPNDTHFGQLWGLNNTGQTIDDLTRFGPGAPRNTANPGTAGRDMGLLKTWDLVRDCSSTIVAVVDTGVQYNHLDLAANMWDGTAAGFPNHGTDTYDGDTDPMDEVGHGTHVAGTIGAVGNNNRGTTGVCWKVQIMAVKVFGDDGSATSVSVSDGIKFAIDNGAHVINMSLGGEEDDAVLHDAVEDASAADIIVISAAGNDGTNNDSIQQFPCNYRFAHTLCVAALNQTYGLADFSNYGKTTVDVAAPGVNIASTWNTTLTSSNPVNLAGWTTLATNASVWGSGTNNGIDFLSVPAGWDGRKRYLNNSNSTIHKSFDLGTAKQSRLSFSTLYNLLSGDVLNLYLTPGSVNPVTVSAPVYAFTGLTGNWSYGYIFDISSYCPGGLCSMALQLKTNSTGQHNGALFYDVMTYSYEASNAGYNITSGTSMAAPHVAGVAALVRAFNPGYSALEVVKALKFGGHSLSVLADKTTTGRVVSALGAVNYLQAPVDVEAVYVPPTPSPAN